MLKDVINRVKAEIDYEKKNRYILSMEVTNDLKNILIN
jgi:hypothetical protein